MSAGIVLELRKDCLEPSVSAASLLRKAKVIASKLELSELQDWINSELNGYECSPQELPAHRKGSGQPKFFNPYRGWCPIQTADDWFGNIIRTVFLTQSVSEIEHLVDGGENDTLQMTYNSSIEAVIQKQLPMPMEVGLHFSKSVAIGALDFVRNKTLDWTLELEQRGITGEGMTFGEAQKKEASAVTNHIYGGNFGVLGTVSGNATNSGFISISGDVTGEQIQNFANQVSEVLPALPSDKREAVASLAEQLKAEAAVKRPMRDKIAEALASLRTVLEGASGNLAAQGILAGIAALATK